MILEELKINEVKRNFLYEKVNAIYINEDKSVKIDYKL